MSGVKTIQRLPTFGHHSKELASVLDGLKMRLIETLLVHERFVERLVKRKGPRHVDQSLGEPPEKAVNEIIKLIFGYGFFVSVPEKVDYDFEKALRELIFESYQKTNFKF